MYYTFQRRYITLIQINESIIRLYIFKILDSNIPIETINISEKFIILQGPSFFIISIKGVVEGTLQQHLFIQNREVNFNSNTRRLNSLATLILQEAMLYFCTSPMTFLTSIEYNKVSYNLYLHLKEFNLFQVVITFEEQLSDYSPLLQLVFNCRWCKYFS